MARQDVESVRQSGPLHDTFMFPYESNIYRIIQLVTGTKGVEQQIAKKCFLILCFDVCMADICTSSTAKQYCNDLFSRNKECTSNAQIITGVAYFGKGIL